MPLWHIHGTIQNFITYMPQKMFILKYKTHKDKFSNYDGLKVEVSN